MVLDEMCFHAENTFMCMFGSQGCFCLSRADVALKVNLSGFFFGF